MRSLPSPPAVTALALAAAAALPAGCGDDATSATETLAASDPALTVCLTGPAVTESDARNPFLHYRLDVAVDGPEGPYTLPGYFAADGRAHETGARAGDQWCARLRGYAAGTYHYTATLRGGDSIALGAPDAGEVLAKAQGRFRVDDTAEADGWLRYDESGYPRFSESGKHFLKTGTNSPENFLAFGDFDGTYSYDTAKTFVKTYETHVRDWREGDPTWRGGKGKGIVGAINYLESVGVNSIYALTNNIGGDARDVWPWVSHDTLDRFDVSKLAQWDIAIAHAQDAGILVQLLTQEAENETMLDGGDTGPLRQLYYRELVARLGHHPMIVWNLGEENGRTPWNEDPYQSDEQRSAMVEWFADNDPYGHPVVIHTLPDPEIQPGVLNPLLGREELDGLSMQIHHAEDVHDVILGWRRASDSAGRRWMLAMDEIGPWYSGSLSDAVDPEHDTLRKGVLWGALMAGAYGVEWYYGWHTDQHDLNAEDFRTREGLYGQAAVARGILEGLPFARMAPADSLVSAGWALAGAGHMLVYLPEGGECEVSGLVGEAYRALPYKARTGAHGDEQEIVVVEGEAQLPSLSRGTDWAVVLSPKRVAE